MSVLSSVQPAPSDPILGLTERFVADSRPDKVNLGVGVYLDEHGKLPLLRCVDAAEQTLAGQHRPKGYLPIDGLPAYTERVKGLVFGRDSAAIADGRIVTVQALGGTGALKIGADFLHRLAPEASVLISTPSWENHQALFTRAGFEVRGYRYYAPEIHGIDVDGMLADLRAAPAGTIVVLHACCHNPTGYDLTPSQWDRVIEAIAAGGLVPFVDMAYQGFSTGLDEDAALVRKLAGASGPVLCANSFSKSFGLYGERVGALSIVCADADEAARVRSQVKVVVRTNYSNPPTHGALLVATVLGDPQLRLAWTQELGGMRDRIRQMRSALAQRLAAAGVARDMSFITGQVGMFSYSGLDAPQMGRLRDEFGVYGTDAGRICVAALNQSNLDRVACSIAAVM